MKSPSVQDLIFRDVGSSEWLNTYEAAEYLKLKKKNGKPSEGSIRNLVNEGRLPSYKPFGRLLFRRSELQKIIETSRKG